MRSYIELKVCIYCCFVLGLHVNLSEGVPLCNVQTIGSLLSADKVFLGKAGIRSALENGTLNMDEVCLLITWLKYYHNFAYENDDTLAI